MMLSNVSIIIPCYNEGSNLIRLLAKLESFISTTGSPVIIVDDGSKDDSSQILSTVENEKITTIRHTLNRGYGAAIKTGIVNCKTDYCVTVDGDGQHDLSDIRKMMELLVNEDADLVVGNRQGKGSSSFRNFGKWIIRRMTSSFVKLEINDLNSGMKLYKTNVVKSLIKWVQSDMSFSETITLLHLHFRYKVLEKDINVFDREAGESTINYKTAVKTVQEILFLVMNFFPLRFFGYLGLVIILLGIGWSVPFFAKGEGLTIGAGFLLSFGLLVIIQGVILQTLTRFKFEGYEHFNNK